MGKISPVANKYIIHSTIQVDGVVDRPDVIGAIFGQTEGLLGEDLELRELQRSGRIGRIEVNLDTSSGKTKGKIIIPSSLDKSETSIVAAALEIIQRIGPCNAKINIDSIEDVRVLKRNFVVTRAKELLKKLMESSMPDSQELSDEVAHSVRVMEIQAYGKDKLPAGPGIEESDEIIVVEGRADVLNLLKNGFKNVIATDGTNASNTIIELCKRKTVTVFLDGDRGGILNFQELSNVTEIDFVVMAPDGMEVEELTKKEIHKALRGKITAEQALMDFQKKGSLVASMGNDKKKDNSKGAQKSSQNSKQQTSPQKSSQSSSGGDSSLSVPRATQHEKDIFRNFSEDLVGTRGAYILDEKLNILGKVPLSELEKSIKSMKTGVHAVVFDGTVTQDIVKTSEASNIKFVVGMDSKVNASKTKICVLTVNDL
ncbi:MAG: DNA primase DnaG [Candidatus Woesearchaeota archaeon]